MKNSLQIPVMACALFASAVQAQVNAPSAWGTASGAWSVTPRTALKPTPPPPTPVATPRPGAQGTSTSGALRTVRVAPTAAVPPAGAALQAANRDVLAEARAEIVRPGAQSAPPDQVVRHFGAARPNTALPATAPTATACAKPLTIGTPRGTLTPGGLVYVRGCDLGSTRGELRMAGRFSGGLVKLEIQEWTPKVVIAVVPGDLRGVDDQPVRLQIAQRDGKLSNEQSAQFVARRETVLLPESLIANTNCAHPQPSECGFKNARQARWASGVHHGSDTQPGRDEWRLSIGPSWQLERVEWWQGSGEVEVAAQPRSAGGQVVVANWRSVQNPLAFESSDWYFSAEYGLRFHVTGPAGVPFAAGVN